MGRAAGGDAVRIEVTSNPFIVFTANPFAIRALIIDFCKVPIAWMLGTVAAILAASVLASLPARPSARTDP